MIDAEVDNSARMIHSATNTNHVNTTDRNVQARPQTSDAGVDNSARMVDAGIETDSPSSPGQSPLNSTPTIADS